MACRPGMLLRLGGVEIASAGGVMLDGAHAYVLTAGHACDGRLGQYAEFFENNTWHDLGHVENFRNGGAFDAGVIASMRLLVDRRPLGMAEELHSLSFARLGALRNQRLQVILGQTNTTVVGEVTDVHDGAFSLQFTLADGEPASTNGDSGSPLIVTEGGQRLLAGILIGRPNESRVIRFIHPTPALNSMRTPIP